MWQKLAVSSLATRVEVASAGTHGYHIGEPPDPRTITAAARRGYDLRDLRATKFSGADFKRFDWVLALDRTHLAELERLKGAQPGCPPLLMTAYSSRFRNRDVPDPYYGNAASFEQVLDMVEEACDGLLKELTARLARASSNPAA